MSKSIFLKNPKISFLNKNPRPQTIEPTPVFLITECPPLGLTHSNSVASVDEKWSKKKWWSDGFWQNYYNSELQKVLIFAFFVKFRTLLVKHAARLATTTNIAWQAHFACQCFWNFLETFFACHKQKCLSSTYLCSGQTNKHCAWQTKLPMFAKQCLSVWPGL